MRTAALALLAVAGLTAACGSSPAARPSTAGHTPASVASAPAPGTATADRPTLPAGAASFRIDATIPRQHQVDGTQPFAQITTGAIADDGSMRWTMTTNGGSPLSYRSAGPQLLRQDKNGTWVPTAGPELGMVDFVELIGWGARTPAETLPKLVATTSDWHAGPSGYTGRMTREASRAANVARDRQLEEGSGQAWTPRLAQESADFHDTQWAKWTSTDALAVTWRPTAHGGVDFTVTGTNLTLTGSWSKP